jgi:hypothetical protein
VRYLPYILIATLGIPAAWAEEAVTPMTREELSSFLPNKQVKHLHQNGSLRRWVNEPNGEFIATSDNKQFGSVTGVRTGSAAGTWKVDSEGRYCVTINWKRVDEKWCATVLKGADGSYYLNQADDAHRIEFANP